MKTIIDVSEPSRPQTNNFLVSTATLIFARIDIRKNLFHFQN